MLGEDEEREECLRKLESFRNGDSGEEEREGEGEWEGAREGKKELESEKVRGDGRVGAYERVRGGERMGECGRRPKKFKRDIVYGKQ